MASEIGNPGNYYSLSCRKNIIHHILVIYSSQHCWLLGMFSIRTIWIEVKIPSSFQPRETGKKKKRQRKSVMFVNHVRAWQPLLFDVNLQTVICATLTKLLKYLSIETYFMHSVAADSDAIFHSCFRKAGWHGKQSLSSPWLLYSTPATPQRSSVIHKGWPLLFSENFRCWYPSADTHPLTGCSDWSKSV